MLKTIIHLASVNCRHIPQRTIIASSDREVETIGSYQSKQVQHNASCAHDRRVTYNIGLHCTQHAIVVGLKISEIQAYKGPCVYLNNNDGAALGYGLAYLSVHGVCLMMTSRDALPVTNFVASQLLIRKLSRPKLQCMRALEQAYRAVTYTTHIGLPVPPVD